jgi:hypothetical protein
MISAGGQGQARLHGTPYKPATAAPSAPDRARHQVTPCYNLLVVQALVEPFVDEGITAVCEDRVARILARWRQDELIRRCRAFVDQRRARVVGPVAVCTLVSGRSASDVVGSEAVQRQVRILLPSRDLEWL